ncbi:MAG: hypothetical protein QF415_05985 [Candidatus Undinarchaeales archaeon]|jgi:hypothetical protein|nr:hypothetical protein [Candidatus Undinarchaeales archaeon]MDP7491400.1 hypothetical protein [Candidatus Undinarchaeales archaeon]
MENTMRDEEFIEIARKLFEKKEFSVADLMVSVYGMKPRSDTPEYRTLTSKLRVLEKRKLLYSRKVGNLKRYRLQEEIPGQLKKRIPPINSKDHLLPEEYLAIREMVIDGIRTGRIPLSGVMGPEKHLLPYLYNNIHRIIASIKAPYEEIHIKTTPLYIELIPMV